jgi:dipeptidyl aminopeptidase/acylaminoacyl peptidase
VIGDHVTPGDVWTLDLGGAPRRLSDVNAALRAEVALVLARALRRHGSGVEVEGWVMLPPGLGRASAAR